MGAGKNSQNPCSSSQVSSFEHAVIISRTGFRHKIENFMSGRRPRNEIEIL